MNKKYKKIQILKQDNTFLAVSDAVAAGWAEPIDFAAAAYKICWFVNEFYIIHKTKYEGTNELLAAPVFFSILHAVKHLMAGLLLLMPANHYDSKHNDSINILNIINNDKHNK